MRSGLASFIRFSAGMMLFISLSLGITYAVSVYEQGKSREAQAAAALEAMLR